MALLAGDQRELSLPLMTGVFEERAFGMFLERLRARTGAHRVMLFAGRPGESTGIAREVVARGTEPLDLSELDSGFDLTINALRPERVYALAELPLEGDMPRTERRAAQGLNFGRLLRVTPREDLNAWLLLFHATTDFTAADSALLSALAPHFAAAIELRARLDLLELRASVAEDALARLGIAQAAVGPDGRALFADPGLRLPRGAGLAEAARSGEVRLAGEPGTPLLVRPFQGGGHQLPGPVCAVAAMRRSRRANRRDAAVVLERLHGLSAREAQLADALSRGEPLVEAGVAIGLTPETARNYSKRIYAKTGTTGQADLARLILEGLAVLA